MANFTGRLAPHIPDPDTATGYEFGHFSPSVEDRAPASLGLSSTLTGDLSGVARFAREGQRECVA
jgi:hypothetical protein